MATSSVLRPPDSRRQQFSSAVPFRHGPESAEALDPRPFRKGARPLPDYELVQALGRGGCGEVWKARGPGGFHVALKFIRLADPSAAVERRSLDCLKDIRHPHLLTIFGAWQRDGYLIIAMEMADRTLHDRLLEAVKGRQPGIPGPELHGYLREAARGLDHLNGLGVQHRDVKPANLFLVGGGTKVGDFGLAKIVEAHTAGHSGAMTPAFAPPEFLTGTVTPHSDQYSLAVTYYQLRTGTLPFAGNEADIASAHLFQPPDLSRLPESERPAVLRALAKRPEQRWPSCGEFAEALVAPAPMAPRVESKPVAATRPPVAPAVPQASPAPDELVNHLGMRFLRVAAGGFRMGSPDGEPGRYKDEWQHPVEIARDFYLGIHEVTQEEYERILGRNPSWFSATGRGREKVVNIDTSDFPVEDVSWYDAQDFCRALGALPEERQAGRSYRLPTEAEWEYACRGGPSASGDGPATEVGLNFDTRALDGAARRGDYLGRTNSVRGGRPNRLGLCDMRGNVWEWCADWYDADYYRLAEARTDPKGPESSPENRRVVRGGAWSYDGRYCRPAARLRFTPEERIYNVGFRVVLVVTG